MTSREAIAAVVECAADAPIVANLGHASYELFAVRDRPANFYLWGSMGLASSVGLGLALAQPERPAFVLDGDGSLLMNLGSLATIAWQRPRRLVLLVLDNREYGTTGGQPTATAQGADLEAAARAMGMAQTATARTLDQLREALVLSTREPGPWTIVVQVAPAHPRTKPPLDCVFIKQRFMAAIGCPEPGTIGQHHD